MYQRMPPSSATRRAGVADQLDVSAQRSAHQVDETSAFDALEVPVFLHPSSSVRDWPDAVADLEHVAKVLDRKYLRFGDGTLPRSFADLRQLGVDETLLDSLAALVAGDVTEEAIVRAFLEALESAAKQAGASRQLLRALRNQFTTKTDCAELRAAVVAIVRAQIVAGSPTP